MEDRLISKEDVEKMSEKEAKYWLNIYSHLAYKLSEKCKELEENLKK